MQDSVASRCIPVKVLLCWAQNVIKTGDKMVLALLLTALAPCVTANSEKEQIFCRGLNHFYNSEYETATTDFQAYETLDPTDPRGDFRELLSEYFRLHREPGSEGDRLSAIADVAIFKSKSKEIGDVSGFYSYVEAYTMSIKAAISARQKLYRKAHDATFDAWQIAEQSNYQDAGFVVGFINYEVARAFPHGLRWLALGLPHDEDEGRRLILRSALDNDGLFADDIRFFIFGMETERNGRKTYSKAELDKLWSDLIAKYPRNRSLINYGERIHHHVY